MLQAKVKQDYRFGNSLQAFSRVEFIKSEWRDVPAEFEAAARTHAHLEIRERPIVEAGAIETVAPADSSEAVTVETLPTAERELERMLAEHAAETGEAHEEVKETRRGRSGKRG